MAISGLLCSVARSGVSHPGSDSKIEVPFGLLSRVCIGSLRKNALDLKGKSIFMTEDESTAQEIEVRLARLAWLEEVNADLREKLANLPTQAPSRSGKGEATLDVFISYSRRDQ